MALTISILKNILNFKCMHIEISEITDTVVQIYSGIYPQKIWILPEPVFSIFSRLVIHSSNHFV